MCKYTKGSPAPERYYGGAERGPVPHALRD